METICLTQSDIAEIVARVGLDALMDEMIDGLTHALSQADEGFDVRPRSGFQYTIPAPGVLEWMPVMHAKGSVAIKVVSYNPRNVGLFGLPTIVSTLSLYDARTGHLVALCDGILPTAMRTGAASAIASRILADPESRCVGLVGGGAQAVSQLHALTRTFDVRRALVFDADAAVSATLAARCEFLEVDIDVAPLAAVEQEADILCTATSVAVGAGPVISGEALKPSIHINAVGSDLPGKIELPVALLRRSLVCPDFLEQARVEGECQQLDLDAPGAPDAIGPALPQLVQHAAAYEAYRQRPTVFDSTGFGLEDHVALEVFLGHAQRLGLGQRLIIESCGADPYNPYPRLARPVFPGLPRDAPVRAPAEPGRPAGPAAQAAAQLSELPAASLK